jgi:hypothetical protein
LQFTAYGDMRTGYILREADFQTAVAMVIVA